MSEKPKDKPPTLIENFCLGAVVGGTTICAAVTDWGKIREKLHIPKEKTAFVGAAVIFLGQVGLVMWFVNKMNKIDQANAQLSDKIGQLDKGQDIQR